VVVQHHDYRLAIDSGGKVVATSADGATVKKPLALVEDRLRFLKYLLGQLGRDELRERAHIAELGDLLYAAVLGPPVQGHFDQAFREAKEQGKGLRIRLELDEQHRLADGTRSAALPWEFLHDNRRPDYFLATHPDLTLSRFVPLGKPASRPRVSLPLKVLFVASTPEDLAPVFTESALEAVRREFGEMIREGRVVIEILEQPSKRSLVEAIEAKAPHVLHFMGHARFREEGSELALVDAASQVHWLRQDELQILFATWRPYLTVLIACQGAAESLAWAFVGLAQRIVDHNIQVVAMQFEVTNQAAMGFTRELYKQLAIGEPIDVAVQQSRRSFLVGDLPVSRDFGAAVLHLRSPDGVILPPAETPPPKPRKLRKESGALARYCRNLEDAFALVDIVGAPVGDPPRLEHLYVEQAVSPQPLGESVTPDAKLPAAADVLRDNRRLVLLGDPGGGKSTLVQWITWQFAVANLGRFKPDGWPARLGFSSEKPLLPLPFILRELKIRDGITWDELWRGFLDQTRQRPLNESVLHPFLKDGRILFLLDSLDEIGNPAARRSLRDAVLQGMRLYPKCRWLLTSRVVGYDDVPFHTRLDLRKGDVGSAETRDPVVLRHLVPFDEARIQQFIENWYVCREPSTSEARRKADDLRAAVFRDPGTMHLARIPFLLTLMASSHRDNVTLPNGRARLYKLITDAYVEKREVDKKLPQARFPTADQWACLTQVGLEMQQRRIASKEGEGTLLAGEDEVRRWLAAALKQDAGRAGDYLDYLARRTGLLLPRGEGQYGFIHLSLMEFFAACYLRQQITSLAWSQGKWDRVPSVAHKDALHRYAADPRWHVVLVFVSELLAAEGRRDYLEEGLFPALFGENFAAASALMAAAGRGVLLARLVADPCAGWDEKAGWADSLRQRALAVCCQSAAAALSIDPGRSLRHQPDVLRALFTAEPLSHAALFERLIKTIREKGLQHLSLAGTAVRDLGPLASLSFLQSLSLNGTTVKDVGPLACLASLQELSLAGTGVTDLGPLAGLTSLRSLSLNSMAVTDLSPLAGLTSLQELYLSNTRVMDLGPLAGLTSLRSLAFDRTSVADLRPLAGLTSLKSLSMNGTVVTDLGPLQGLNQLHWLSLRGIEIPSAAIASLKETLTGCQIAL
jgi:internalin A